MTQPNLYAWTDVGHPLRLVEPAPPSNDPDRKALACSGLLVRGLSAELASDEAIWLRFVDGRPVSAVTIQFLIGCCGKLEAAGKRGLWLVWDNASWHISQTVKTWLRHHNRQVKREGRGMRIVSCLLPTKSPWLNPIEPKWLHGKRRVVEPDGLLTADQLIGRVYDTFGCAHELPFSIPEKVI